MSFLTDSLSRVSDRILSAREIILTQVILRQIGIEDRKTNAQRVFSSDYMREFIGKDIQGAGDPRLNLLMEELMVENDRNEVNKILSEIAEIRGVDAALLQTQYDDFQHFLDQADPIKEIDLEKHPNFLGSIEGLRFGKVVGDVLGIDPIFGSLLSPTGGIVGPGNTQLYNGPAENALAYHGIFHDAAGYLSQHNTGLGYEYRDGYLPFPNVDPVYDVPVYKGPLDGQIAGIEWWQVEFAKNEVAEGRSEIAGEFREGVYETWSEIRTGDRFGTGKEMAEGVYEVGREVFEAVDETTRTVTDSIGGVVSGVGETVGDKIGDLRDGITDRADDLRDTASETADKILDTVIPDISFPKFG